MKIKKIIALLAILITCLSIASIAFAAKFTIENAYFSEGKSHKVEGEMGQKIYVWTKANQLVNSPEINIKCQGKVGLFFVPGSSVNKTITSTGTIYTAGFTKESTGTTRVVWKQTNSNASMSAYLDAHDN